MNDEPDLRFGPDVATSGFTPAGIAAFSDLRPAAVVRELIQNSLDAALGEAQEKCAKVRFCQMQVPAEEIPGIESYRKAFDLAEKTQVQAGGGRMPTQAEAVVDRIRKALEDSFPCVLSVTDNGVGLNDSRMSALLSDGVSAKSASAAGTFGNGHSVAVPASDLRYVLYGGLVKEGRKIGAGQAIIASHNAPEEKYPRSSRGFYIKDFRVASDGSAHEYASGSSVPSLIDREIEWIREHHGHGAAVIIPYFNNFQDPRTLQKMVARAAACNFFQAIYEGQLVVEVEDRTAVPDDDETGEAASWILNDVTLLQVLEEYKDEKRIRSGAFLTGERANQAFDTLQKGKRFSVSTALGEVSLGLEQNVGSNQVCLIRNGMWITDSLPELRRYNFSDRRPFRAILLLEPANRNELYKLIQWAETPLHNDLAIKQLSKENRGRLRAALREVREFILAQVPKVDSDSFTLPNLLDVQFEGVRQGRSGSRRPAFWGAPMARRKGVHSRRGDYGTVEPPGNPGVPGSGSAREKESRIVYPSLFQVASAPAGPGRQRVQVVPRRGCKNARLRMFVDENIDATCDRQGRGEAVLVRLSNVFINGDRSPEALVQEGQAIRLGDLSEGREILVEVDYAVPEELLTLSNHPPTLRVEVVRVREDAPTTTVSVPASTESSLASTEEVSFERNADV